MSRVSPAAVKWLETSATFSDCRKYRYTLYRRWKDGSRTVMFLMLNPSTATAEILDPTVTRCVGFAQAWGFDALYVGNIFALRSTDPKGLYNTESPGADPENDTALLGMARKSDLIVAAWGNHGAHLGRAEKVRNLITWSGRCLHALKINQNGEPGHPLYVKGDTKPMVYRLPGGLND